MTEEPEVELKTKRLGRPKGGKTGRMARTTKENIQILELAGKNLPATQIAGALKLPERTVRDRLAKFRKVFKELRDVKDYELSKASLLSAAELKMLKSAMSEERLAGASLRDVVYGFREIHAANRLTRGQATSITESRSLNFTRVQLDDLGKAAEPEPVSSPEQKNS